MNAPPKEWAPNTIFVLGSSHHTASLDLREKIAVGPERIEAFYDCLRNLDSLREVLILNTCNRIEIYGVSADPEIRRKVFEKFCDFHDLTPKEVEAAAFWKTNHEVVEHLFQVSAGVDSQMVGETEIFGQVKQSYSNAQELKAVGPVLNRVFQRSFKEAKWARTHTSISRGQVSIGNVAVDLATRIFGDLDRSRILVIGAGEVAVKTAQSLQSRGADRITVTSRTYDHASEIANTFGGSTIAFEHFKKHLPEFDILIASTSAPGTILSRDELRRVMKARAGLPLFIIDTAIPRDVDPAAGDLDNLFLYNLDDLSAIANENLQNRLEDLDSLRGTFARRAWQLWLTLIRRG